MKRERLTRVESRRQTRLRLVEAAEKIFIRQGFGAASVEQISLAAGFSRGAFYSNFADKDEIFLAVLAKRRDESTAELALLLGPHQDLEARYLAARHWYTRQWRQREWIVLRTEFQLRALRSRTMRARLVKHWQEEMDAYAALVSRYFAEAGRAPEDSPSAIALSLLAMSLGLGSIALMDGGRNVEAAFDEAQNLAFDRLIAFGK